MTHRRRNWLDMMTRLRRQSWRWTLQCPPREKQVWICNKKRIHFDLNLATTKQVAGRRRNWLDMMTIRMRRRCWKTTCPLREKQVWIWKKAIKTHIEIWGNNQPSGGRQEEILAQNYEVDDASSAEKEAGLNLQKGKTKITHALIWILNTKQWNPQTA